MLTAVSCLLKNVLAASEQSLSPENLNILGILDKNILLEEINDTISPKDEMFKAAIKDGKKIQDYIQSGDNIVKTVMNYVKKLNPLLLSNKKVLDYGCAHGRITRHITKNFKPSLLVSADVWDDGIEFCSEQFGSKPFLISNNNPISNLGEQFDIIIAISVFSHLPPNRFQDNLKALYQSLSDEGLFFFSTHGDYYRKFNNLTLENGYFFGPVGKNPNHTEGRLSGDEYSFMCVTKDFVEKQLQRASLEMIEFKERGNVRQDLFIVKKSK